MKPESQDHRTVREEILALVDARGLSARRDAIAWALRPAIGLRTRAPTEADLAVGATRVGGCPDLPEGVAWPEGDEGPLLFVLQVRLADVTALDLKGRLPEDGLLSVFADPFARDVRVHHHPEGVPLAPRLPPAGSRRPAFRACGVDVLAELHLPPPGSDFVGGQGSVLALDDDERDTYWDEVWLAWRERMRPGPAGACGIHQLLGYAVAERLDAQGLDEEVLVGFDSDDRAAIEWGDVHCVWALITRADLAARAFGALRAEM